VRLVADAVRRAGSTDRAAVRRALAATRGFAGVTGLTTINAQRDADKDAAIITIRNGRQAFVEAIRP
jgi:branched-chain amino acid transport system substrate-binding protein